MSPVPGKDISILFLNHQVSLNGGAQALCVLSWSEFFERIEAQTKNLKLKTQTLKFDSLTPLHWSIFRKVVETSCLHTNMNWPNMAIGPGVNFKQYKMPTCYLKCHKVWVWALAHQTFKHFQDRVVSSLSSFSTTKPCCTPFPMQGSPHVFISYWRF